MSDSFDRVVEIMATLRAPGGCPWDRKQTHESLRPYLLEETYEVLETIDQRETTKLKEELGDILLQVLFHSQIATEEGTFTVNDVVQQLGDKLIRRHPHVFHDPVSDKEAMNADQVVHRWEEIKRAERQASGKSESVLQDVPKALPALLRAFQVQARAARVGFDWPDNPQGLKQVFDKIEEELRELRDAWSSRHEQAEITSSAPRPVPQHSTPWPRNSAMFFFLWSIFHGTSKSIRKTRFDKPRTGSPSASDISKIRRPGQAVR